MALGSYECMTDERDCNLNIMGFRFCNMASNAMPYYSVIVTRMRNGDWLDTSVQYTSNEPRRLNNPIVFSNGDELSVIVVSRNYWTTNSVDSRYPPSPGMQYHL